jgi:hypothetical protein
VSGKTDHNNARAVAAVVDAKWRFIVRAAVYDSIQLVDRIDSPPRSQRVVETNDLDATSFYSSSINHNEQHKIFKSARQVIIRSNLAQ